MDSPPQEATAFPEGHLPNMQEAARALANRDIPLVEYGQQIQWRFGYDVVLTASDTHSLSDDTLQQ